MANINKIKLSGTTYEIQDLNATKTVELTQAEYDALSQKDPNVFYIITDAKGADLSNYYTKTEADDLLDTKLDVTAYTPTDFSNYYTKSETSGATEISTALASKADTATTYTKTETDNAITAATSTKQDTLVSGTNIKTINGETLLGEGNITIQGGSGGGKAIEAGTNISITTGETADTINCTLPMKAEVNNTSIYFGTDNWGDASGGRNLRMGYNANALGEDNICLSTNSTARGFSSSIIGGRNHEIYNINSFIGGGYMTNLYNKYEASVGGQFNNSVSATASFGDSGNTLFSVGNGTSNSARHNAFEIRQNGDIYITKDGQDVKLQDQLGGGGGSSYTAGDGIDITNNVISVTGKVDTSTYNTYTAATDTALASKQTTLTAGTGISIVDNVISATGGGGGGESCTVDSTTMFYSFSRKYSNSALDMRARYAVLDYGQHKTDTPNVSINVNFRDDNYNTYVRQNINLDYSTSSYTLGDISQAEYIDVTYDSTIEDFKIAVATAYTSTVFVEYINFWEGKIKVPFYTISSGSPCTVIENDIPNAISELSESMLKGLGKVSIIPQQDAISIYTDKLNGDGISSKIKLDEIDGSNSTLKPDIYVGLGTSGWTEINLSKQCDVDSLKATKYRVTYNYSEFNANSMGLQLIVEYGVNLRYDYVNFDKTQHPSLQTIPSFSAATVDWNASTKELVITYPETVELNGKQESVKISNIHSNNCQFGQAITKLESYGEEKQALKSYVKETRAALGGLKLVKLSQSEYDSLSTKDSSTLYIING